jgi:hypothetical protein
LTNFEFVSVLLAIVVGLGITRILSDLASLLEHRAQVNLDGITLVWCGNVLAFHLIYWWVVLNNWRGQTTWSFSRFSALFLYGVALYFCAALILPREAGEGADLRARFDDVRAPFFLAWLAMLLLELLDSFLKGAAYVLSQLGIPYLLLMGSSLAFTLIALRTSDRRFHWFFALQTTVAFGTWVSVRFFQI